MVVIACLTACWSANHYLVHPQQPPAGVVTWSDDVKRDQLLVHLEGARPPGRGPFPTVLVHPEGGKTADDMKGIIWDLAGQGYLAIAADYQRLLDGRYQRNMFVWRSPSDATAIVELASTNPDVDPQRIALLGFSQGGVFSLLIAAYAPDRIKAVVSYYPVTDFPRWLGQAQPNPFRGIAFAVIRWYFRRESGAESEAEFQTMLQRASPYYVAESIQAPVLLIHGDHDTTAPVEESQRMADRLAAAGKQVKLVVVPNAVHIFNFRQPEAARTAWEATLDWLDRHVRADAGAGGAAVESHDAEHDH